MTLIGKLVACTSRNHDWTIVINEFGDYDTPEEVAHILINQIESEDLYVVGDVSVYRITSCEEQVKPAFVDERTRGPWLLYDNGKRYVCNGELVKKFDVYKTYELVERS